ncbi:uncharacterized protein LACBIDRAFT_334438 [Laccaria bicolor S238N-H82]|uniref:Predicted protein n=1 Tax=Laccaria bicolor (strain S238N-H82 / ATCC MYA-4686) TaxID=486041 RepID=B0DZ77_LACBS|nr:uncharacterized protein LACBIDRAFT_334438 [Laccaria bicolor S238N-H82]EDR00139.1 predicted protein [Laccaria bicolor S238N-H82]|eukprot:XP_001889196.1 predicted protein [Laccaria bicolor S238N-H82]
MDTTNLNLNVDANVTCCDFVTLLLASTPRQPHNQLTTSTSPDHHHKRPLPPTNGNNCYKPPATRTTGKGRQPAKDDQCPKTLPQRLPSNNDNGNDAQVATIFIIKLRHLPVELCVQVHKFYERPFIGILDAFIVLFIINVVQFQ